MVHRDELILAIKDELYKITKHDALEKFYEPLENVSLGPLSVTTGTDIVDDLMEASAGLNELCREFTDFVELRMLQLDRLDKNARVISQKARAIQLAMQQIAERAEAAYLILSNRSDWHAKTDAEKNLCRFMKEVKLHKYLTSMDDVDDGVNVLIGVLMERSGIEEETPE